MTDSERNAGRAASRKPTLELNSDRSRSACRAEDTDCWRGSDFARTRRGCGAAAHYLLETRPHARFATRNILTFKNSFTDQQASTSATLGEHLNELRSQILVVPGVESAAAALALPTQLVSDLHFDIEGRQADRKDASGDEKYIPVTAGFFETLDIPAMQGRTFTDADIRGAAPVLIVNQQFARTYFGDENPVGQRVLIGKFMGPGFEGPVREIVGVVGDVRQSGLDQPAPGIMYLPAAQIPDLETRWMNAALGESWVVRTRA